MRKRHIWNLLNENIFHDCTLSREPPPLKACGSSTERIRYFECKGPGDKGREVEVRIHNCLDSKFTEFLMLHRQDAKSLIHCKTKTNFLKS